MSDIEEIAVHEQAREEPERRVSVFDLAIKVAGQRDEAVALLEEFINADRYEPELWKRGDALLAKIREKA